jgi:hypothetical protein
LISWKSKIINSPFRRIVTNRLNYFCF